jgi:peptidyl-prolyl cis-trans isomerase D
MLQNIRDKMQSQKWLTYLLLGALALVFAAWGAYGIVDVGFSATGYAAKVNGEKISATEINDSWQQRQPQLLQANGGSLTDAQRGEFQQQLLDSAVNSLAATQHARTMGYRVSDDQVKEAFQSEQAFQVDGKFNVQTAIARLAGAGITAKAFEDDLRRSLLSNQLAGTIGASDFLTPQESKRLLGLMDEERELRYLSLQPEAYVANAPIAATEIEAYYKSHQDDFTSIEAVRLVYAEMAVADVAAAVQVPDADLQARYEKDKASYIRPEQRRARHILLPVDGAANDAKVLADAKGLVSRLKGGADFAALAKEFSKDSASAAKGGDLDWAAREVFVKEFAEQLFGMKVGELSDPVKTQFGYHIIRLDEVRAAAGRSFEDVRAELATAMRNEQAMQEFGRKQDKLQEQLERVGTNFDQLVQEFGLRRGEVAQFERGAGGLPLGSDAELNRAVFADATLSQRRIGGPVQLGEDRITIFQVQEHRPAKLRPQSEVEADIVAALQRERGTVAARVAADALLARLRAGEAFENVATSLKLKPDAKRFVGRSAPDLPVQIRDAAFQLSKPAAKPSYQVLSLDDGSVAVLEVSAARVQSLLDNPQLQQLRTQRELQRYSQRDVAAYLAEVVKAAKVKKNPQVFQ